MTSVARVSTDVVVTGRFSNVGFTRTYRIGATQPVLEIVTEVTNRGSNALPLRIFETADPDQGGSSPTSNDVSVNPETGLTVAQATDRRSVLLAMEGGVRAGFGSGSFGLGISNAGQLNSLFSSPRDPNGARQDVGFAVASEFTLDAGETRSVTAYYAASNSAAAAVNAFEAASDAPLPPVVPVPAALPLMAAGLGALALAGRRRRA
jgi:hypothetical protein